ncbi:DUF1223 domain-containing protein [Usitatibacter palustris]|uniref:DUF1223 domain-containing protein n=1 Tax=Usitatibacter palustris TaxID=2732487 RepID=A0A6M4H600_9PROT|nr:DUF1223 domain-containing protein [Usitatibacter palustris]QJR14083.1 hypothetical protein DSM104440_00876 [Usitatibacter palustris]
MRVLATIVAAMIPAIAGAECTVKSGPSTNVLVELYTSEGCSSCPPADRWFSALGSPRVIPISFHVAYWDYLGWRDRFAQSGFTDRQRALARATNASSVYTPQVVVAGRDFPRWRDESLVTKTFDQTVARPPRAGISMTSRKPAEGKLATSVNLELAGPRDDVVLHLAVVENGLASRVTAGENRGESLRHDHVVRELSFVPAVAGGTIDTVFAIKPDWKIDNLALVAFVQNVRTGEVLQALRSPACRS